jgi:indole-3-glycerol phosphate synthase
MLNIDVGSIVPSTRDLLQVIATRKKSLALVALLGDARPAEEAARLHELNVSALAFAEAGTSMQLAARATKTVPTLCLAPVTDRDGCLAARFHGADGVSIDGSMPLDDWDKVAKIARTMRMIALASASTGPGVESAVKAGARALLLRAETAAEALALAAAAPRSLCVVAEIAAVDLAGLRSLAGHVDAVIVPPSAHADRAFPEFVADVDP